MLCHFKAAGLSLCSSVTTVCLGFQCSLWMCQQMRVKIDRISQDDLDGSGWDTARGSALRLIDKQSTLAGSDKQIRQAKQARGTT